MAKRKNSNAAASLVPMLTAGQVTTHLGIGMRTLYRLTDSRKMTCCKLDGLLRFNPADVKRFVEKRAMRGSGFAPAPFETLPEPETLDTSKYRSMTDEEAQAFFAGVERDEDGNLMCSLDDDSE